jgi:dihydrodipicolinate synthase/N-acetylneuraminate lyase
MKAAMAAAGIFRDAIMRPPTVMPDAAELARIRAAVAASGLTVRDAA